MTYTALDGTEVVCERGGTRPGVAHQTGHPLPSRVLEACDRLGGAGGLRAGALLRRRAPAWRDAIVGRLTRRPCPGIRIKLNVHGLHEADGCTLVLQTFAQSLCCGTSFAQRLGDQTFGSGTNLLEKAAHLERGLQHSLHPPFSEGLEMPHEFQHAHLAVLLRP